MYELKKDLNNDKYEIDAKSQINNIEPLLNNSSIYGYKLLGAGGGFFLVIGKIKECKEYLTSVGLNPIPIEIDNLGCNIFRTTSE